MNKKQMQIDLDAYMMANEELRSDLCDAHKKIENFKKTLEELAAENLKMYRRIKYLEARDHVSTATINKLAAMLVDTNRESISQVFDNLEPDEKEKITINANGTITRVATNG